MKYIVENTTDWDAEKISSHGHAITACLAKYVDTFPSMETLPNIIEEVQSGRRQLWVIWKDGEIVSAFLTEIVSINATGKKLCRFAVIGGEDGPDSVGDISATVEPWARDVQGADYCEVIGRRGWLRRLKTFGYDEAAVAFRKTL